MYAVFNNSDFPPEQFFCKEDAGTETKNKSFFRKELSDFTARAPDPRGHRAERATRCAGDLRCQGQEEAWLHPQPREISTQLKNLTSLCLTLHMIKIHIIRHYRWKTTHPWSILTHWMLICSSRLVISPSTNESRTKVHDSCGISVRSVEGKLFILILIFLKRWLMSGSKQNFTHTHTISHYNVPRFVLISWWQTK